MTKLNTMKIQMAGALIGALFFMQAASAAEPLPEAIKACATMRNDIERLACYDRAVAHIETGEEAPSKENMFGASTSLATPKKPERETKDEDLQQISGKVVAVSHSESGAVILTLDNGQVWRQQDSDATLVIEIDDSVTISRASLGTFRLTDKRGRSARFRRVR